MPALRPAHRCRRPTPPQRSALSPPPLPMLSPRARRSPSPDSGSSRHGPAQLARGVIPAPASPLPSPPPGCRPSRLQRPSATHSTHSEPSPVDNNPAPVPVARTRYGGASTAALRRLADAPASPASPNRVQVQARRLRFRLATCDRVTFGAGRSWGETLQLATRANACAGQRPTSDRSRAGVLIWRAAGLLRRQRCGQVRAVDAPPAPKPLTATAARETDDIVRAPIAKPPTRCTTPSYKFCLSLLDVGPSTFDHTNPVLVRRVVTSIPGHHVDLTDSISSRRTTPHPQHPGIF